MEYLTIKKTLNQIEIIAPDKISVHSLLYKFIHQILKA